MFVIDKERILNIREYINDMRENSRELGCTDPSDEIIDEAIEYIESLMISNSMEGVRIDFDLDFGIVVKTALGIKMFSGEIAWEDCNE